MSYAIFIRVVFLKTTLHSVIFVKVSVLSHSTLTRTIRKVDAVFHRENRTLY